MRGGTSTRFANRIGGEGFALSIVFEGEEEDPVRVCRCHDAAPAQPA